MRFIHVFGCTEAGPVRPANEDHILVGRFVKNRGAIGLRLDADDDFMARFGVLAAVADGVGGQQGGAVASRLALSAMDSQFYSVEKADDVLAETKIALEAAADRANQTILSVASHRPELGGMGCTVAGICLTTAGCLVFHAGDSRVFRYRNGALKQVTADDSVAALAARSGRLTPEEAACSPIRHTITNYLGSPSFRLNVERPSELRDRDIVLACSDGLHDLVPHEIMEKTISRAPSAEAAANALTAAALRAGGHDNIAVVVIAAE